MLILTRKHYGTTKDQLRAEMPSLSELYKQAEDKTFYGEVVDRHNIRGGKVWTVIEITGGSSSLEQILEKIHQKAEGRVWKGFTGPPDGFNEYRIWVNLREEEGVTRNFRVVGYQGPFHVDDQSYSRREGYCFEVE
jgi:hypothetical protein